MRVTFWQYSINCISVYLCRDSSDAQVVNTICFKLKLFCANNSNLFLSLSNWNCFVQIIQNYTYLFQTKLVLYKQFKIIPICFKPTFQTRGVHIPNCRSARSVQNCRVQLKIINHLTNWLVWLMNQFYSCSADKCRIQLTVSPVCRSQGPPTE